MAFKGKFEEEKILFLTLTGRMTFWIPTSIKMLPGQINRHTKAIYDYT